MTDTAPDQLPETAAAQRAKKRRIVLIWLRVAALLFAALFFLSQCAMSKSRARVAILESCMKNVPFAPRWQNDLQQRALRDTDGTLVKRYCTCMWDEPLQKLSHQQIQSFAQSSPQQQLEQLGGAAAFEARDRQCLDRLNAPTTQPKE